MSENFFLLTGFILIIRFHMCFELFVLLLHYETYQLQKYQRGLERFSNMRRQVMCWVFTWMIAKVSTWHILSFGYLCYVTEL